MTTAAAFALAALLAPLAGRAEAAPVAGKIFPAGSQGLTEPNGLAVTPDGAVWASDARLGLCRLDLTSGALVQDEFCAPAPVDPVLPPGAVEPVPVTPTRPTGTSQIAFDAAGCTVDTDPALTDVCNFFVAEGTSGGSGVWRMHWNSQTRAIDAATKIYTDAADQRVTGLALAPGGAVDFSTKRSNRIERIAAAAAVGQTSLTSLVGTSVIGATSLARLGSTLYVADGGSLSAITSVANATVISSPAGAPPIKSLLADPARGVLFAGTSGPQLSDSVLSVVNDVFRPGTYDRGFANVTSMALGADGDLYVAHDPTAALSLGIDAIGHGEVFVRRATSPNPPDARFTAKPRAAVKSGPVRFAFEPDPAAPTSRFDCMLDGASVDCGAGSYETSALLEGRHSFTVRAANADPAGAADWGVTERWGFTIDDTRPVVRFDEPSSHTAAGGRLRLHFSADESAAFSCQIDGEVWFGCGSPEDLTLALGAHRVSVIATDAAGNASDPVDWDVTAVPAPDAPAAPPVVTPARPAAVAAAPAPAAPAAPAQPLVAPVTTRVPQIDIGVPCVAVSAARRESARFELSGPSARVRFRPPAKARYAKFTLRRAAGNRRDVPIVETLGYSQVRAAGAAHSSRIALTRSQRGLVRSGRMRLAVAYGTCRTQVGRWQWVSPSSTTQEGSHR